MKLATISQTQGVGGSVSKQRGSFVLMMTILYVCWLQSAPHGLILRRKLVQLYTEVIKGVPTVTALH